MSGRLAYDNIDDASKFREQCRFVFSIAIIATYFIIPDNNILWKYLGYTVGFSAIFSMLYIIMSAAQLKYSEPGRMYEVINVNEGFRMWAFDWSVNVFAASVLFFFGILFTGITFNILGSPLQEWITWVVVIGYTLLLALSFILLELILSRRKNKKDKPVPRI